MLKTESTLVDIDPSTSIDIGIVPTHRFISNVLTTEHNVTLGVDEMKILKEHYCVMNRSLDAPTCKKYAKEMEERRWRDGNPLNSIGISCEGQVINGQHRIHAAISVNRPLVCTVTYGVPKEFIESEGEVRPRSPGAQALIKEMIAGKGEKPTKQVERQRDWYYSIVRQMVSIETDVSWAKIPKMEFDKEYTLRAEWVQLAAAADKGDWKAKPGPRAAIALFAKIFPEEAKAFRDQLYGDGANLASNSPVLLLRNRLLRDKMGGSSTIYSREYTIAAINAFYAGLPTKKLTRQKTFNF